MATVSALEKVSSAADEKKRGAFILRMSTGDDWVRVALECDIIGIGWSEADNAASATNWQELKKILREAYPDIYQDNERALGNAAGTVWRFIKDMKRGDFVIVPIAGQFHVAEIIQDAPQYSEKGFADDLHYFRKVKWLTKDNPVSRNMANNDLQKRLKARQTCVDATGLLDEVFRALKDRKPVDFVESALDKLCEPVVQLLRNSVNDGGLENIVAKLARTSGARTVVLPKKQKLDGDVDVLATYDLQIAQVDSSIRIAYQIKQHEGVTDINGIQQLVERMKDGNEKYADKWCFVSTADSLEKEAEQLANDNDIMIVLGRDLAEWVLSVGINVLREKQSDV